jgi:hypothetical protein
MELTICFCSSIVVFHQQDVDASQPNKETVGEKQTSIQTYHLQASPQTSLNV